MRLGAGISGRNRSMHKEDKMTKEKPLEKKLEKLTEEKSAEEKLTEGKNAVSVDIVIPVYCPGEKFLRLMQMLAKQTHPIGKIILMNTEERLWTPEAERVCRETVSSENAVSSVELHHLSKEDFDHAATRRAGIRHSNAAFFICMTDDAVPADEFLVERLLDSFSETAAGAEETYGEKQLEADRESGRNAVVAEVYARQLPTEACGEAEQFTRLFNYPETSFVKSKANLPGLGIKTYFASNVCCAYRRAVYDRLGGFCGSAVFNEDMIFASKAIQAGYLIAYRADARVLHAHRYTALQQLRRNFDLGMSQAMHPEVFSGLKSEGEGIRLVKATAAHLLQTGHAAALPGLFWQSACKYLGFRLGRAYRRIPYGVCLWLAMNRIYLQKHRTELWGK